MKKIKENEKLIDLVVSGDSDAFSALVEKYSPMLKKILSAYTTEDMSKEDIEDLGQDNGNLSVTVCIGKLAVAGLQSCALQGIGCITAAVCIQVGLLVGIVLDDSVNLITIEITDRITYLYAVKLIGILGKYVQTSVDNTLRVGNTCNLILVV